MKKAIYKKQNMSVISEKEMQNYDNTVMSLVAGFREGAYDEQNEIALIRSGSKNIRVLKAGAVVDSAAALGLRFGDPKTDITSFTVTSPDDGITRTHIMATSTVKLFDPAGREISCGSGFATSAETKFGRQGGERLSDPSQNAAHIATMAAKRARSQALLNVPRFRYHFVALGNVIFEGDAMPYEAPEEPPKKPAYETLERLPAREQMGPLRDAVLKAISEKYATSENPISDFLAGFMYDTGRNASGKIPIGPEHPNCSPRNMALYADYLEIQW